MIQIWSRASTETPMTLPMTQWLGSGFGHIGSTSKRGACTPAACTAALFSKTTDPIPSATISPKSSAPIENLRFIPVLLFPLDHLLCSIAGGQDLVRIHAHDQIHNLRRCDLAEPMRGVRRNNDDVPRSDFAAHSVLHDATLRAGPVQHLDDRAVGRGLLRVFNGAAGDEGSVAFDEVVHLGDLAVLDGVAHVLGFGAMHHADTDVVFVIDADDADGLIADSGGGGLLHRGFDLGAADVGSDAARLVLCLRQTGAGPQRPDQQVQHPIPHAFSYAGVFRRVYITKWRKAKDLWKRNLPSDRSIM